MPLPPKRGILTLLRSNILNTLLKYHVRSSYISSTKELNHTEIFNTSDVVCDDDYTLSRNIPRVAMAQAKSSVTNTDEASLRTFTSTTVPMRSAQLWDQGSRKIVDNLARQEVYSLALGSAINNLLGDVTLPQPLLEKVEAIKALASAGDKILESSLALATVQLTNMILYQRDCYLSANSPAEFRESIRVSPAFGPTLFDDAVVAKARDSVVELKKQEVVLGVAQVQPPRAQAPKQHHASAPPLKEAPQSRCSCSQEYSASQVCEEA